MTRKFMKRPVIIEAFRYGVDATPGWCLNNSTCNFVQSQIDEYLLIETLEGVMKAEIGDYVIKGIQGEIYPCKSQIFEASYDELANE